MALDTSRAGELGRRAPGAAVLRPTFGEAADVIADSGARISEEARRRAEAEFRSCARRFVIARGVCETGPRVQVGTQIDLQLVGPMFSGTYYVNAVRHTFDGSGWSTAFSAETPGIGA